MSSEILHKIGLIADIQYADVEDGYNFQRTKMRHYRNALCQFQSAVKTWKSEEVDRVLQLGDFLDGKSDRSGKRDADFAALRAVVASLPVPWHHCVGNHELYNFNEAELKSWINEDDGENFYRSFLLTPGFRCLVLDTYAVSTLGKNETDRSLAEARDLLEKNNPSADKLSPEELQGLERRWVAFNGGLGEEQLRWLERSLREAEENEERVIIACHAPLHQRSALSLNLVWDFENVIQVINRFSHVVFAVFAGHDHDGGFYYDEGKNILYLTFHGVIETSPSTTAFAVCDIYRDKLVIDGHGDVPSFTVKF